MTTTLPGSLSPMKLVPRSVREVPSHRTPGAPTLTVKPKLFALIFILSAVYAAAFALLERRTLAGRRSP